MLACEGSLGIVSSHILFTVSAHAGEDLYYCR